MEYISHEDYKKILGNFGKEVPKAKLNEGLEKEGNAFTAGLAKAKKGQSFKVGDKTVKDTSNYDAPVNEYQFDQMYPDDPGPFEGKDEMEETIKEFLAKESAVNWERVDDEEAESDETDNGIEESEDMEEGLNSAPLQATGPTIQTVEGKASKLAHLTTEERDQLRQYVETIKTVKEQINKMVSKGGMEEGGDNTNLIMKPSTVSEKKKGSAKPQGSDLPDFITRQYEE